MSPGVPQRLALLFVAVIGVSGSWVDKVSATELLLRWTTVFEADGYRLYVGPGSRAYTSQVDVGLLAAETVGGVVYFLVPGLEEGHRYFFAVTAYNSVGESDYSNEKEVVVDPVSAPVANAGPDQSGVIGDLFSLGSDPADDTSYIWLQRSGPPGTVVGPNSSKTFFRSDSPGIFEFAVMAYDGRGFASIDSVQIEVAETFSPTPTPSASPTETPTASPTPTPTVSPISTSTPTDNPSPTLTPTSTATAAAGFCSSDVGQDAPITVADIVKGVNIALGALSVDDCPAFDSNGDWRVTIDELIQGVNRLLSQPALP